MKKNKQKDKDKDKQIAWKVTSMSGKSCFAPEKKCVHYNKNRWTKTKNLNEPLFVFGNYKDAVVFVDRTRLCLKIHKAEVINLHKIPNSTEIPFISAPPGTMYADAVKIIE
jgi:hypothetical protein